MSCDLCDLASKGFPRIETPAIAVLRAPTSSESLIVVPRVHCADLVELAKVAPAVLEAMLPLAIKAAALEGWEQFRIVSHVGRRARQRVRHAAMLVVRA